MRSGFGKTGCNMLLENVSLFFLKFLNIIRLQVPVMVASEGRERGKRKPKWNTVLMSITLKRYSLWTELNINSKCLCLNYHLCFLQMLTLLWLLLRHWTPFVNTHKLNHLPAIHSKQYTAKPWYDTHECECKFCILQHLDLPPPLICCNRLWWTNSDTNFCRNHPIVVHHNNNW